MPKPYTSLLALLICSAAMVGCDNAQVKPGDEAAVSKNAPKASENTKAAADESSEVKEADAVALANPAAEFCVNMGGRYMLATESDGEKSECHLANGKVVDAWALYRAHAKAVSDSANADSGSPVITEPLSMPNPAAEYCEKIGGKYFIEPQDGGEAGMCQLADGTTMNAWDLFRTHHKAQ
ncbi:DUF333 domain-containing protein [Shewanella litorisediminis]|uniref:DUF333 domain-containing protein n=1 Tax=Shewanella litorisediminis TaxID=1173586 RepID=A0ABX7G642_9GAMM|nr:DUF333 domain-containing protein [Shewanella litorisediminis]MCL2917714.1 DUF333 domain-containing protein [Shewanella litorisediminis]QRH02834.1 DUF333 domain-containing protein [Shewanella litorisediminis]